MLSVIGSGSGVGDHLRLIGEGDRSILIGVGGRVDHGDDVIVLGDAGGDGASAGVGEGIAKGSGTGDGVDHTLVGEGGGGLSAAAGSHSVIGTGINPSPP